MEENTSGYQELEHTADWALRVWGRDLETLFATAAEGMNSLGGIELQAKGRVTRRIEIQGLDNETLLVEFLNELLYLGEDEGLAFDVFKLKIDAGRLAGEMEGAPLRVHEKEIKAVTFHNMKVEETAAGFEVVIVFDV
jgi:SHS2 domain-containing protein